jgi:hypothetical protein
MNVYGFQKIIILIIIHALLPSWANVHFIRWTSLFLDESFHMNHALVAENAVALI